MVQNLVFERLAKDKVRNQVRHPTDATDYIDWSTHAYAVRGGRFRYDLGCKDHHTHYCPNVHRAQTVRHAITKAAWQPER